MLFASDVFLFLFLPVALLGYQLLSRWGRTAVFLWLGVASLFFYGYWNPKYLLLLCASVALNFSTSRWLSLARTERRKTAILWSALALNLALLGWFKYLFPLLGFFHGIGWLHRDFGHVILPLGMSFFTFTQMAYLVDLREEQAQPQGLLGYLVFVTFFPHLIAGPLLHHSEMMPQLAADKHRRGWGLRADDLAVGTTWFVMGLAKKTLIADKFGPVADALYARPTAFGAQAAWVAVLCYAVQLYFDFSGYSDMALGLARMFSLSLPLNFNSPYKARNISEFWQRWHITLTRYLNLYLFNPMALALTRRRADRGQTVTARAQRTLGGFAELIALPLLATMLLAGIWHGAGLQFIVFGLVHGIYLTAHHAWRIAVPERSRWQRLLPAPVSIGLTFACVLVGQVFFRAGSVAQALTVLGSLAGVRRGGSLAQLATGLPSRAAFAGHASQAWLLLAVVFAAVWTLPNTQQILGQVKDEDRPATLRWLRWQPNLLWAAAMVLVIAGALTMMYASTSFLYFQF